MRKQVLKYIKELNMLKAGDRVLVAVSGGADSVCLLHLLAKLKEELQLELLAVHVHHNIRGTEADRDSEFVKELCSRLLVPCHTIKQDVPAYARERGISLEEAGREIRYQVFEQEAESFLADRIAIAHHRDDNAETILHHLFRGSGLKGLGGIPPVRGKIIRPLLNSGRADILAYLEQEGLSYCTDSTNAENDYTRNKLRNQILPLIVSEINERAVGNLINAAHLAGQADEFLEKQAMQVLKEHMIKEEGQVVLETEAIASREPILRAYLVMQMLAMVSGSKKDMTARHVNQVLRLLEGPVGKSLDLPCGIRAEKGYDRLSIGRKNAVSEENVFQSPVYTMIKFEKGMEIPKNQYTKWFDYDKIKGTLSVRSRQSGDYITLGCGGKKTVKSYMIDEKIPRTQRGRIPVLADGNHVLWIIGYRISEYYKVTEYTKNVLQVQYDGGKDDG